MWWLLSPRQVKTSASLIIDPTGSNFEIKTLHKYFESNNDTYVLVLAGAPSTGLCWFQSKSRTDVRYINNRPHIRLHSALHPASSLEQRHSGLNPHQHVRSSDVFFLRKCVLVHLRIWNVVRCLWGKGKVLVLLHHSILHMPNSLLEISRMI